MIHVLLDTNVILDVLLDRTPWSTDAVVLWQAKLDGQFTAYVTATSLTDIFYITRRYAGREKAWQSVYSCLDQLSVIPVGIDELRLATTLNGNDFEDSLQIACAISGQLDLIVTRNLAGFPRNNIPILTPQQMLLKLTGNA
ncbi:MAG: PIN domain-containing protein [Candidatus Poribacteria bacterium]|nr:PIN domain-containing protein [Candidatus Poribacteria bacterium]